MDKENMKAHLQMHATDLLDKVDYMRIKGANEKSLDLLERISNLGSIAVLNFEALEDSEIQSVLKTITLCEETLSSEEKLDSISSLDSLVSSIERLFREKRILLDVSNKKGSI